MKRLIVGLFSISLSLGLMLPSAALASSDAADTLKDAGVVIATEAPEASAAALLKLPDVYALPGSFSYWLNQVIEEIQLIFTSNPEDRTALLLSFSQKRLAEGYEAIKRGDVEAAVASLQRYQDKQIDLTTALHQLDKLDAEVMPYLETLNEQLEIQQSLKQYSEEQEIEGETGDKISSLLEVSPVQRLAWSRYHETMLLGETDVHMGESTQSASPSAELSQP